MIKKASLAFVLCLSSLILAFHITWYFLVAINFSYGFWHNHTSIATAIEKYASENRQGRPDFHKTSLQERERVFAAIVQSVRSSGAGLAAIEYQVGSEKRPLLTDLEVLHLQDVANLIDLAPWAVVPAWLLLGAILLWHIKNKRALPSIRSQSLSLLVVSAAVGAVLIVVGPTKVFNQLHIWIFPPEHPWFFYYQDSLMSTMMHAPVLFGGIAAQWAACALAVFALWQVFLAHQAKKGVLLLADQ